ncbi:MAG: hypothetical protein Q8O19_02465 [Rectinemataceae bacterium]|nr:hypothetical protein [Rectinemataceae bacterium]
MELALGVVLNGAMMAKGGTEMGLLSEIGIGHGRAIVTVLDFVVEREAANTVPGRSVTWRKGENKWQVGWVGILGRGDFS